VTEAGTYHCPTCGAPTAPDARRCEFCAGPVATVRCARCFHMNPYEARHCSGCGHELGLEPCGGASEMRCPGCQLALVEFRSESGALFDCERCGGQFLEHRLLRALLERREVIGRAGLGQSVPVENSAATRIVYRPCPTCSALMHRKNFGGRSGVIVDVCTTHGTWFDLGELPRVLAFVETGGLERARQAEKARERPARTAPVLSSTPRGIYGESELSNDWRAASELIAIFLDHLRR